MSLTAATVVVGTRPEVLKMAPVLQALDALGSVRVDLCAVAQQGALLDLALRDCALSPSVRLLLGEREGDLGADVAAAVQAISGRIRSHAPAVLVVHGDTTTALAGALAGFYAGIPVAHVEAGLRSGDPASPFPEEMHRALVDRLATVLYAPTPTARDNLLREGIPAARIAVVGNTSVDALAGHSPGTPNAAPRCLVTCHRRENLGEGVRSVCAGLLALLEADAEVEVDYVLHSQPAARHAPASMLGGHPRIRLHDPLPHRAFLSLLGRAALVLTDSGGVQEEAASIGRSLLVLRAHTERVEAVRRGAARVVGTSPERIVEAALAALATHRRGVAVAPIDDFGDGLAGVRIARDLVARFGSVR